MSQETDSHDAQLRRQNAADGSGGAQMGLRDPRVSAAAQWLMNVLQGLIVIALAFVANNLYQVNLTLAANAVMQQEMSRQLAEVRTVNDRQEDHINYVDRRVYTLEGRTLRGVPNGH